MNSTTKRLFLFFFILLLASCAILNPKKEVVHDPGDIVRWTENYKLTWDDFKATPIKGAQHTSEIYIYLSAEYNRPALFLPGEPIVECYMDKNSSWVVKSSASKTILFYHQTIFDIYELYARKLRKKLAEKNLGIVDPMGVFNSIYKTNNNALNKEINTFRTESKMGTDFDIMKLWSEKTIKKILALDGYR